MTATLRERESHVAEAGWLALAAALLLAALTPSELPAQERRNAGLVARIPSAISTEATNRLRSALYPPHRRFEDERNRDPKNTGAFYLVCDFNPEGRDNASDDFGACLTLADFLHELHTQRGIQVVAYVHGKVSHHAVLPVLACSEIIMSSDPPAQLGRITDADRPLKEWQRQPYAKLANPRYPPVLVRKMHDGNVEVIKTRQATYRDANDKPRPAGEPVAGLGRGETALYSFQQARDLGLCQPIARNSLEEVMDLYRLPRGSLYPSLDRFVARRIIVSGLIDAPLRDKVKRRVRDALGQKANLLIFELACGGGESQAAYELALHLTELNDNRSEPVYTVAYVTGDADSTAAFLALACNKIVMQREIKDGERVVRKGARLGGFERYAVAHQDRVATIRQNLAEIAARRHYPAILAEAMLDRDLHVVAVESAREESARKFLSETELNDDREGPRRWRAVAVVKPAEPGEEGHYLTLTAERARELGLAREVVSGFDEVCELEGVRPAEVRSIDSDWLDGLVDFFKDPWTSAVLVMLGITCLILELKMPGASLPGIVSAICFLLFFWSHSQVSGQIIWLALLLFLLGLVLIGLEIFVVPGFGVTGVSGILLVLGSIGLVAYGHWPRSNEEWVGYGNALKPFTLSILGAVVAAFVLARYLPHIPYANRLMLKPHEASEFGDEPSDAIHPETAALLGAIGVAATPLRPAGKVQFGDDFVDVVAEGSYVLPGSRVQVIEIEGNRIVVKEV